MALTTLLASDHMTNGFAKLASRIAMMLDHITLQDVITRLVVDERMDQTDVRLALAAAQMMRSPDWPLGPRCGECGHLEVEHGERDLDGGSCGISTCDCGTRIGR